MKTIKRFFIITVLMVTSLSTTFGQTGTPKLPFDSLTNKIAYSDVVKVDSLISKQELISRAREWFAKAYKSSTNVIQMEDKEAGRIVGKALIQVYHKSLGTNYPSGDINYTISIYAKDGRYKYEITNFYHETYGVCEKMINTTDKIMGISYQKTYNYYLYQVDDNIKTLISDLKSAMASSSGSKNNEW